LRRPKKRGRNQNEKGKRGGVVVEEPNRNKGGGQGPEGRKPKERRKGVVV